MIASEFSPEEEDALNAQLEQLLELEALERAQEAGGLPAVPQTVPEPRVETTRVEAVEKKGKKKEMVAAPLLAV